MKILFAEDDFVSRKILNKYLSVLGEVDIASNGKEAITAVKMALDEHEPYELICLDVMMKEVDGIRALQGIRRLEEQEGVKEENRAKIVMASGVSDKKMVVAAAKAGCDAYLIKPITKPRLFEELSTIGIETP
ncbi:MAG: response regulator [Thermodesulfobacteriota bacterium]